MEIQEIIDNLRAMDLSKDPRTEIQETMKKVGELGLVVVHLSAGTPIMRGRPNKPNERFEKKSDYSFKPPECNKTYQRASTPYQTVFYGVVPNSKNIKTITSNELKEMRQACFCEVFHKGIDLEITPKISFGRWQVKSEEFLNLIAIVQEEKYNGSNILLEELNSAYQNFLETTKDEKVRNSSLKYNTFLANEFSKIEISTDYDYMISAIYSEFVIVQNVFDGVMYPSVRNNGKYFNIAISPDVVNKKIELLSVGECPIIQNGINTIISKCDYFAHLQDNEDKFELKQS